METFHFRHDAERPAGGTKPLAIVGVVASGNCEVLVERTLTGTACEVEVTTPIIGFGAVWEAVVTDFVERRSPGGLRLSVNDGGARADTVALRLAQAVRLIEDDAR